MLRVQALERIHLSEGGITCMRCLDPNSGQTRCGQPGVEEVEEYCGDDAIRACVEINVNPIGDKYRDNHDSNEGHIRLYDTPKLY